MFRVAKYYRGRFACAVENIDQGRMIDYVFGEIFPEMDRDGNWSVSIEKI